MSQRAVRSLLRLALPYGHVLVYGLGTMDDLSAQLRQLHEDSPLLVAVFDGADRLRYANGAYRSAYFVDLGESPTWAELMRRNALAQRGLVIDDADMDAWLTSAFSRRGKTRYRSVEAKLHDGRWLLMAETVSAGGWMLCIGTDITEIRADARAVRRDRDAALRAAHTDDLTGVANRRFVTARVEDMLARSGFALGLGTTGCLAVLDLDNFKYINDRYGHQAGDAVLRDFARRIIGQVRRSDCFGRVGGEEFVLVLPDTALDEAALIVERMLGLVRTARPLEDRPEFGYTFSAGIGMARAGDSFTHLYGRADKALYAAKMDGRNRVRLEEDPSAARRVGETGI